MFKSSTKTVSMSKESHVATKIMYLSGSVDGL